jgi:hypothetical protein
MVSRPVTLISCFHFFFSEEVKYARKQIFVTVSVPCHFLAFLTICCSAVRGRDIAWSVHVGTFSSAGQFHTLLLGSRCLRLFNRHHASKRTLLCVYINPLHVTHKQSRYRNHPCYWYTYIRICLIIHHSTAKPICSWYFNKRNHKLPSKYGPINR